MYICVDLAEWVGGWVDMPLAMCRCVVSGQGDRSHMVTLTQRKLIGLH